ncbi:MAG: ROK family protein [Actinobacteria bacterium]|nr:ROK family protein [Actinomycetota bacterium]
MVDRNGVVIVRERVATPAHGSGDEMFSAIADLVDKVTRSSSVTPVVCGVGTGGPMTRGGVEVSPVNIPAWRSFPLLDRGGGIVLDGRLLDGADGNAGHIGHICVEPEGRLCGCGARGCLEAEASGTAIAAYTGRPAAEATSEVIERTGRLVGRAVATVANLLDLRLGVVAGSVALGFGDPFFAAANDEIALRAQLDFSKGCELRRGGLGADGPLIGAAAVGWRGLDQ